MRLADEKFCRTLARRHLPRLVSGIMPLQHISAMIPRRKRDLDLVYRYLLKGMIKWNSFRLIEKFLHSSIKTTTYVLLPPAFSGLISGKDASDKRREESKPINKYPGQILLRTSINSIVPNMHQVTIPASIRSSFEDKSWTISAKGVDREPSRPRKKSSGPLLNLITCHGCCPVNPGLVLSSQVIMCPGTKEISSKKTVPRTFEISSARIRQGREVLVPNNRLRSHDLANPGLVLSSQAIMCPGTKESPSKKTVPRTFEISSARIRQGREVLVPNNRLRSHDPVNPGLVLSSQAIMQPRTNESSPKSMVPRTFEIYPDRIRQGREVCVHNHRFQSHDPVNPGLILSSRTVVFPRSIAGLPIAMKKRPGFDISHDFSAGTDRSAVRTARANRRYMADLPPSVQMEHKAVGPLSVEMEYAVARSTSVEMEYKAPLSFSVEKEAGSEDVGWRYDSKPPAINMNKLSDQVYSIIERKIKIERERRGIYV